MANPIQSGVDSDYQASTGGDVGLPESVKSALKTDMSDPLAQFKKISGEERAKVGKAESDLAEAQIAKQQQAAQLKSDFAKQQAGQMSGLLSQYEKQAMAPAPKREIDPQTKEGMMGLAALLPVAGAFFGGKGLTSATGAMQAMTGLLKGYQEGNKERIAFEQKKYDDAMKEFDRHQNQIKEAFNIAIKKAQVNQTAAQTELEVKLAALDAPLLREMVKKNGIVAGAEENIKMAQNYYTHKQQYEEKLQLAKDLAVAKGAAESSDEKKLRPQRQVVQNVLGFDPGSGAGVITNSAASVAEADELLKEVEKNPQIVGRTGQASRFWEKIYNAANLGTSDSEVDKAAAKDPDLQKSLLLSKKFATYLVGWERSIADNNARQAGTVYFQRRFNELMNQDQFDADSFKQLLKDMSGASAVNAAKVNTNITYKDLLKLGDQMKGRADYPGSASSQNTISSGNFEDPLGLR